MHKCSEEEWKEFYESMEENKDHSHIQAINEKEKSNHINRLRVT